MITHFLHWSYHFYRRISQRSQQKKGNVWLPTERALAENLGVSRTILREATKRLESQGLLQIEHGRGLRVVDNLHHPLTPLTRSIYLRLPVLSERLEQLGEVKLFLLLKKSRRRGSLLDEVSEKMLKKIQRMSGKGGVAPQPTCMLEVSAHR